MTKHNHLCRVWDIIEKVGVCMLTTQFAGGLRARPIEARTDRDAGLIFFVTDVHSAKDDEINAAPDVGLVFIDPKDKAYTRKGIQRGGGPFDFLFRENYWISPSAFIASCTLGRAATRST